MATRLEGVEHMFWIRAIFGGGGDHQARGRAASALSELCQLSDHNKLSMVGAGAIPLYLV